MVPGSWPSVLLFFLLVAPGLLFDLLSERRRAGFSESAFREVSRVVLGSLAFSGFAFVLLAIVRTVHPAWMPDPKRLLDPRASYAKDHYRLVLRTLVLQESLALTAASAWHIILAKKQSGATIRQVSAWTQVFKRDRPKGHDAYVRVRLEGGVIYSGLVANFTSDAMKERGLAPGGFSSDARGAHILNREGGPGERSIRRRQAVRRDRLAPTPVGDQPVRSARQRVGGGADQQRSQAAC